MNKYISDKEKLLLKYAFGIQGEILYLGQFRKEINQIIEDTKKSCIREVGNICIVSKEVEQYSRAVESAIQKAEIKNV